MLYTLLTIHLLALASPGTDFLFVMSNALSQSRSKGVLAALGVSLSILVWSCMAVMGLKNVIHTYAFLHYILPIIGACYLCYLAYGLFITRLHRLDTAHDSVRSNALWGGFLVNISNPKAFFYFTSVFSSVLASGNMEEFPTTLVILLIWVESFLWFFLVALFFAKRTIRLLYTKYLSVINTCLAILLFLIALSILAKVLV